MSIIHFASVIEYGTVLIFFSAYLAFLTAEKPALCSKTPHVIDVM